MQRAELSLSPSRIPDLALSHSLASMNSDRTAASSDHRCTRDYPCTRDCRVGYDITTAVSRRISGVRRESSTSINPPMVCLGLPWSTSLTITSITYELVTSFHLSRYLSRLSMPFRSVRGLTGDFCAQICPGKLTVMHNDVVV